MLDQPIPKRDYFKRNHYTFLIWLFTLGGIITGVIEGITTLNPGYGLAVGSGIASIALVVLISGSVAYKRYVKAWGKAYNNRK